MSSSMSFQGLPGGPRLHQEESGYLHRPGPEGEGGPRLAAGREDLPHAGAEGAGGSLHTGPVSKGNFIRRARKGQNSRARSVLTQQEQEVSLSSQRG